MAYDPTRRERFLQRVPLVLVEYPLEVVMAIWGLISGPPVLLHLSRPPAAIDVMPEWVRDVWAALMILAAFTIVYGLRRRHFGTTVANGLVLLASTCLAYGVCVIAYAGWNGVPTGALLASIGGLCHLRAWWLRVRRDILRHVRQESSR